MPWDLSSDKSVYLQLMDIIKQKILTGEYKAGEKLPGVRELAADAAVNPNTMQRALTELEREGLLYTQRTNGRFVSPDNNSIREAKEQVAQNKAKKFIEEMNTLGLSFEEIKALLDKVNGIKKTDILENSILANGTLRKTIAAKSKESRRSYGNNRICTGMPKPHQKIWYVYGTEQSKPSIIPRPDCWLTRA